jgi:hypothetical protein
MWHIKENTDKESIKRDTFHILQGFHGTMFLYGAQLDSEQTKRLETQSSCSCYECKYDVNKISITFN